MANINYSLKHNISLLAMKTQLITFLFCFASLASSAKASHSYTEPTDTVVVNTQGWNAFGERTAVTWASTDVQYAQRALPADLKLTVDTVVDCWQGERVGLEALIVSGKATGELSVSLSNLIKCDNPSVQIEAEGSYAGFMRYVITTDWNQCGYPSDTLPTHLVTDMIDAPGATVAMQARSVRPVWCTIEVPASIAGCYMAYVTVVDRNTKQSVGQLCVKLNVADRRLPEGKDMSFYLDLWQQPYAVSRYYGVEPWSKEHFELLKPYAQMLARAGQKTISTILFYEPWGEQSHDKFLPMVQTYKGKDGKWRYDYDVMDRYVEFMMDNGIDTHISCFTMVPWDMKFRYFDEGKREYVDLAAGTSSAEYKDLWTSFLKSLAMHLKQKGWFEKTLIVMDERGLTDMLNAYEVAHAAVPDFKMSLAGSYHSELVDKLESYALIKGDFFPESVIDLRRSKGFTTLMYTCCATPAPSQFSNSAPADGAYIPVYATATGHDGYLHWSFMNWTDNPCEDSRFRMFAPGDTFFVYPDGRSSVRYERMVEGIQLSEKIRLLRDEFMQKGDVDGLEKLDRALIPIRSGALNPWYPTSTVVGDLHRAINRM